MARALKKDYSRERVVAEGTQTVRPDTLVNPKPFAAPSASAQ
jgi:hypothetical protein